MRFLVDAQLPPALARWLSENGQTAEHVADLGLETASDDAIRIEAAQRGAVIVSKDEDFAIGTQILDSPGQVVWVRWGNVRSKELLRRWEAVWPAVLAALNRGEPLVELA